MFSLIKIHDWLEEVQLESRISYYAARKPLKIACNFSSTLHNLFAFHSVPVDPFWCLDYNCVSQPCKQRRWFEYFLLWWTKTSSIVYSCERKAHIVLSVCTWINMNYFLKQFQLKRSRCHSLFSCSPFSVSPENLCMAKKVASLKKKLEKVSAAKNAEKKGGIQVGRWGER